MKMEKHLSSKELQIKTNPDNDTDIFKQNASIV